MPDTKDYTTADEIKDDAPGTLIIDDDGVDFGPDIDVGDHWIAWTEGLSGDWSKNFGGRIDSGTANGLSACWQFASELNNLLYLIGTTALHTLSVYFVEHPTAKGLYMRERYSGSSYITTKYVYTDTVPLSMTLTYIDSTKLCTLDTYSDEARTTPVDSVSLTLHQSPNPTHIYRMNGYGSGQAGRLLSGRFGNFVAGAARLFRRGLGKGLTKGLGRGL